MVNSRLDWTLEDNAKKAVELADAQAEVERLKKSEVFFKGICFSLDNMNMTELEIKNLDLTKQLATANSLLSEAKIKLDRAKKEILELCALFRPFIEDTDCYCDKREIYTCKTCESLQLVCSLEDEYE